MPQRLITGLLMLAVVACAQRRVDPRNTYHRIIAVVPLQGTGATDNPRRPQYAPPVTVAKTAPTATTANATPPTALPTDIIAFTQVPTDDNKFAIVEFVARDRTAFAAILADPTIKSFEKGLVGKGVIEAELRKVKKGFSLDQFGAVMP